MLASAQPDFAARLDAFLAGCQERIDAYWVRSGYTHAAPPRISVEPGRRYVRVVRIDDSGARSAHCFIDTHTGDVLKTEGWRKPAKHARGNLFEADGGLDCMGPYGAAYLR